MSKTRTTRAVQGFVTSFLQIIILIVLQIVLAPVTLRIGGQEVLGGYSFLMQVITWASLVDMGFGVAIGRKLAQAHGLDDGHGLFCTVLTTGRTYNLFNNLVFSVIILSVACNIGTFLKISPPLMEEARLSLLVYAAYVFLRTPLSLFGEALNSTQLMAHVNVIGIVGNIIRLVLSIVMVWVGWGLFGLMMAFIASDLMITVAQRLVFKWKYPGDRFAWGFPDMALFKDMFLFGLTFMLMIIAGRLTTSTDNLLIGFTMGAAAVSVYYTSQMPGALLYQFIWKITDSAWAGINDLFANGDVVRLRQVYLKIMKFSLVMGIGLAGGLLAFNQAAINLWVGPAQYAGDIFTLLWALYVLVLVINKVNSTIIVVYGQIRLMSWLGIILGVVKLGLAFVLLKYLGLAGIILAFVACDLPLAVYNGIKAGRLLHCPVREMVSSLTIPLVVTSLACGLMVVLVHYLGGLQVIPVFAGLVLAFIAAWGLAVWFSAFDSSERSRYVLRLKSGFRHA